MLKLSAIGYIGQDARTSIVDGKEVANFSLAHSYRLANGEERTIWLDCSLWDKPKVYPYLKKGQQLYIEGRPTVRTYTAKDGSTKAAQVVTVDSLELIGSPKEKTAAPAAAPAAVPNESAAGGGTGGDGLPF